MILLNMRVQHLKLCFLKEGISTKIGDVFTQCNFYAHRSNVIDRNVSSKEKNTIKKNTNRTRISAIIINCLEKLALQERESKAHKIAVV